MKKLLIILATALTVGYAGCKKSDFADAYPDPAKISQSTVDKQFAGFINSYKDYVVPSYWNYFVVYRTTINRYIQAVGWANAPSQWVPGSSGIDSKWAAYYNFLAQYRELQKIYAALPDADQKARRIFMLTATIYLYDQTQKMVDLHGDIPFSAAGMLSTNSGDYNNSLSTYDGQEAIYTKMLDDLKAFSDELDTIKISDPVKKSFDYQDLVNRGTISMWKKYNNSLRLRMLTRVSGAAAFSSRATTEIAAILANPTKYPVIAANTENVQINIFSQSEPGINSQGFRDGLESAGWYGNIAGKVMIDHMNINADPRLRVMFEPYNGRNSSKPYIGLDPMLSASAQNALLTDTTLAIYNRSTLSRNQFFPGVLMNAAEVGFLIAEAYLKAGNAAGAKTAYNDGITKSIKYYYDLRAISNDNTAGTTPPTSDAEIATYLTKPAVNWDNAATNADKLKLIATQKWIHFSLVQPLESWSEIRRLDAPVFSFEVDNSNAQKLPPYRWFYAANEKIYNTANYNTVSSKDNLSTKIFWDIN